MSNQDYKTDHCLNCGEPLSGQNYCPNCGQKNDNRRLTFKHFISESLSNLFAVDGRLIHTFVKLFRHPGKVAIDYIQGRRMQYMNPIRTYFLSSLLLLFILQFDGRSGNIMQIKETPDPVPGDSIEVTQSPDLDSLFKESDLVIDQDSLTDDEDSSSQPGRLTRMVGFADDHSEMNPSHALDSLELENNVFNRFLYDQAEKIAEFDDEQFSQYFTSKLFWVLFLFLPVLALILHLLYWRRKFYYPEHLFFTFYTQSVFFVIVSIAAIIDLVAGEEVFTIIFSFGFVVYLYLALKHFYGQGTGKTLLKFLILNLLAFPTFAVFFVLATLIAFILF